MEEVVKTCRVDMILILKKGEGMKRMRKVQRRDGRKDDDVTTQQQGCCIRRD
jgi:hypothetical protein